MRGGRLARHSQNIAKTFVLNVRSKSLMSRHDDADATPSVPGGALCWAHERD